jgi:hypothetical protein
VALLLVDAQVQMDLDVMVVVAAAHNQKGATWSQLDDQIEEVHFRRLGVDMTLRIHGLERHEGTLG